MSYLALPRLAFAGRFLSDVSTRNNYPTNYQEGEPISHGWNPVGGSSFEFMDCDITGPTHIGDDDPVLGARVSGKNDKPSGKMVDLDPQWQRSSEIWGLGVRLFDPVSGELGFQGDFEVAQFRDLSLRQVKEQRAGGTVNQQPSGARYVSVLKNIEWGPLAERSISLTALRNSTSNNKLSIAMHQFGYFYNESHSRHSTGSCVGAIGPYKAGEAETAVIARRMLPRIIQAVDFEVDLKAKNLSLDLGHAVPIDTVDGPLSDLSSLYDLSPMSGYRIGLRPPVGNEVGALLYREDELTLISDLIDVSEDWYARSGGVADVALNKKTVALVEENRLGIFIQFQDGNFLFISEETIDGLFYRTDNFVRRMEADETSIVKIHAKRFGKALPNLELHLKKTPGVGLTFPDKVVTDQSGTAVITLASSDPKNPRGPLDGIIFNVGYSHSGKLGEDNAIFDLTDVGLSSVDVIAVHVRDPYEIPAHVDFDRDIKPIMAQYDQLYPIMSVHLFRLAEEDTFLRYRQALLTAFERPIENPNHMPVSRDLSRPKTDMIIGWLTAQNTSGIPSARKAPLESTALAALKAEDFIAVFNAADSNEKLEAARAFKTNQVMIKMPIPQRGDR